MPALVTLASLNSTNIIDAFGNLANDGSGDLFGSRFSGANGHGGLSELPNANGSYGPLTPLIDFTGDDGTPQGTPAIDAAGDLFLVSDGAPADPQGIVVELPRNGTGYASALTTVATLGPSAAFVASYPSLAIDGTGDLFGEGLDNSVYEIAKTPDGYASTATTLATVDGSLGIPPLTVDGAGDLFGLADTEGATNGGFVFEIAKTATGYASPATTLASFPSNSEPVAAMPLSQDAAGDLFGVISSFGGESIFELAKTTAGYGSAATILVTLPAGESFSNGALLVDAAGNIFGATGGDTANPDGTILELQHSSSGYASTLTTLVSFDGADGAGPADLVADAQGNLIGLTGGGGAANDGTVFEYDFGAPSTVTLGSGSSTLVLTLSERGEPAGAEFTVSVDGTAIGGVQTTTADSTAGQLQSFDVLGNFPNGANTVTIDYLNAANSLLAVNSAALNGVPVATNGLVLSNSGAASFGFTATGSQTPVTVGLGPDVLALTVAERGQPAGAQFTVNVNGTQIGGVQTTSADLTAGQSEEFDIQGSFSPLDTPTLPVLITYLNADNSVLAVENATVNGSAIADSATNISNDGTAVFDFPAPAASGPTAIGSGPDVLPLSVTVAGPPTTADFTVSVNGAQIGGVQTTSATAAAAPNFDVLGNFLPGANTVSIDYLNAANSLLTVAPGAVDGNTPAPITLSNIGTASFSFMEPAAATPGATVLGTGPDTLAFAVSEAGQPSGANFTVDVDGSQIGGVQTTAANNAAGQSQTFDVLGNFAGSHVVTLNYLNASNSLLFVGGAAVDGTAVAGSSAVLSNVGSTSFSFAHA